MLLGTVFPLLAEALQRQPALGGRAVLRPHGARRSGSRCCSSWRSAPALPWRATSGEVLRDRLLDPGVDRRRSRCSSRCVLGARGVAEVLAFGLGAFATAGIVRQFVRRHPRPPRARSASRGRGRARSRDAVEPAALRRARRALRRRAHRGRARGVVGVRDQARGAARSRASRRRCRATRVTYLGRTSRREPRRRRRSRPTSGSSRATDDLGVVRAGDLDVPEQHRGHRHAVGAHRAASTTCTSRSSRRRTQQRPDHARRAHQPDDRVALDRRRRSWRSARSSRCRRACVAGRGRSRRRPRAGPAASRRDPSRRARRCRREAPRALDRRLAVAVVVVVFGVVLALNVGSDPQADAKQSHLVGKARARVRPSRRSTARRVTLRRPRGQDRARELLELVVHPVPAGAPALEAVLRRRTRTTPTSRWSASSATTTPRPCAAYVKDNGVGWTVALDPGRRRARLRHPRPARDLRDLAERDGRRRRSSVRWRRPSSSTFLAAARQTG